MSKLALDKSLRTQDRFGRMRVKMTNVSKANVCPYLGREIPGYQALGLDAAKVYNLWRHPDELAKAAHTFDMLPVLDEHIVVDADNPELESVAGTTGSGTVFDGTYLKVPMSIWVGESIDGVKSHRKRQLSPGYTYTPDMTAGVTPDGLTYDGVMRNITGNHIALVREGRTGPDVMVADEQPEELSQEFVPMKRPELIKALAVFLKADADQVALDAALDTAVGAVEFEAGAAATKAANKAAYDADPESWEDDPEKPGEKRRKAGGGKKHMACDSPEFKDAVTAAVAAATKDMVAKADADKLATDAVTAALAAQTALTAARADVADVVGACALDTAEAVYRFALESEKVAGAKDIHVSALPALWAATKAGKDRTIATDSKTTAEPVNFGF